MATLHLSKGQQLIGIPILRLRREPGQLPLIAHGTAEDVAKAKNTTEQTSPAEVNVHSDGKL